MATFAARTGTEVSGDIIDAIRPDLEAFTSLWTALRVNYEGTNITRTVARLLHMYQPEDGVLAYERLLRTLFVLLEDFDSDGLQLLVSMVPPPKGVDDPVVKEVFHRATGFVRVDAPIFHRNLNVLPCSGGSTANTTATVSPEQTDTTPHPHSTYSKHQQNIQTNDPMVDIKIENLHSGIMSNNSKNLHSVVKPDVATNLRTRRSPQIIPQDSEVFRGFPPNEIYNTQSHVQNINNFYRPANYGFTPPQNYVNFGQIVGQSSGQMRQTMSLPSNYRPKWFQSPYLMQKSAYQPYQDFYLKTVDNQYVKVPALTKVSHFHQAPGQSGQSVQPGISCTSQSSYQALYNNAQEYLRSRTNTVTSGLLEKIQRHRDMQEATIQKIMIDCETYKPAPAFKDSSSRVSETKSCEPENAVAESKVHAFPSKVNVNGTKGNPKSKLNQPNESGNGASLETEETRIDVEEVNEENEALNREALMQFEKEVRRSQRAIQEDIYKMDVVRNIDDCAGEGSNENEQIDSEKSDGLVASEELRESLRKFQNRVRNEESVVVPRFSQTRALNDIHEPMILDPSQPNVERWKLLTGKNTSGNNTSKANSMITNNSSGNNNNNCEESESPVPKEKTNAVNEDVVVPKEGTAKKVVRRKKPDPPMRPKSQRVAQKVPSDPSYPQPLQMISGSAASQASALPSKRTKTETKIKCNAQDSFPRCPVIAAEPATANSGRATTMAELAAYKKQYYDALLGIQKAKVASSLALSTVQGNPTGFDPYYFNYLQQHHQHHQHMMMGPRYHPQRSLAGAAPWIRPTEWRYHPAVPPQRPHMLHPPSLWPPGLGFLSRDPRLGATQRHVQSIEQPKPPPAKRRKLEEIVGKLKETEINSKNN